MKVAGLPSCHDDAVHALVADVLLRNLKFARTGCQADIGLKIIFRHAA